MVTITQLVASIRADYQNFMQGVAAVQSGLNRMVTSAKNANRAIQANSAAPWSFMARVAGGAINATITGLRRLSAAVSNAGGGFNYLAFIAAGAMATILRGAVDLGFGFQEMQTRSIRAFTTLLGSAKAAKAFFQEIKEFAIPTPFESTELVTLAQRLLGAQVEAKLIIPVLKAVGDQLALMGRGSSDVERTVNAMTKMVGRGKITMMEMNSIIRGGTTSALKYLADQQGVTTVKMREMISKGVVPGMWALKALAYQMEKHAPNAMVNSAKDMTVALAGLKDITKDTLANLMAPAYADFTNFVNFVGIKFRQVRKIISDFSDETRKKIVYGFSILASLPVLTIGVEALSRVFNLVVNPIGIFVAAIASVSYYLSQNRNAAKQFGDSIVGILPTLIQIASQFSQLATDLGKSLLPVFVLAVSAIGDFLKVVAGLLGWFNSLPPVARNAIILLNIFIALFNPMANAINTFLGVFSGMNIAFRVLSISSLPTAIRYFNRFGGMMGPLAQVTLAFGIALKQVAGVISFIISPLTNLFLAIGNVFTSLNYRAIFVWMVNGAKIGFNNLKATIASYLTQIGGTMKFFFTGLPGTIAYGMRQASLLIQQYFWQIVAVVANGVANIGPAFSGMYQSVLAGLRTFGDAVLAGAMKISPAFRILVNGLDWVRQAVAVGFMDASRILSAYTIVIQQAVEQLGKDIMFVVSFFTNGSIGMIVSGFFQKISAAALSAVASVRAFASSMLTTAVAAMAAGWQSALTFARTLAANFIPSVISAISYVQLLGQAMLANIATGFASAGASIMAFIKNGAGLNGLFSGLKAMFAGFNFTLFLLIAAVVLLALAWANNWGHIQQTTKKVIDNIAVFFRFAYSVISWVLPVIWKAISTTFQNIWHTVTSVYKGIADTFTSMGTAIDKFVKDKLPWLSQALDKVHGKSTNAPKGKGFWADYWGSWSMGMDEERKKYLADTKGGWDPKDPFGLKSMSGGGAGGFKMPNLQDMLKGYGMSDPGKMDKMDPTGSKKLADKYASTIEDLQKRKSVAESLMGTDSDVAKMRFETTLGALKALLPAQKSFILELAAETDSAEAMNAVNKKAITTRRELAIAIRQHGNETAGAKMQAELEYDVLGKLVPMHEQMTRKLIHEAAANADLVATLSSINKLRKEVDTAGLSGDMKDFAQSVGGLDALNAMPLDKASEALDLFNRLQDINSNNSISKSMDELMVKMRFIGQDATADAVQFAGGMEKWKGIPPIVQSAIQAFVSFEKTLNSVHDMLYSAQDELYGAMHPIQTETEKTIRALDRLLEKADQRVTLAIDTNLPDASHLFLPENVLGGRLNKGYKGDNPASIRAFSQPHMQGSEVGNYGDLYRQPGEDSVVKLRKMRDDLIQTKKLIDEALANTQVRDWSRPINAQISDLMTRAAHMYDPGKQAAQDWMHQNVDAIELTRRSFTQIGKGAEFEKYLIRVRKTIEDITNLSERLNTQMGFVAKVAELQSDLESVANVDPVEKLRRSFYELNKAGTLVELPDALKNMDFKSFAGLTRLSEQLKTAKEDYFGLLTAVAQANSEDPFHAYIAAINPLAALDREMVGFNESLAHAQFNAKMAGEALGKMTGMRADVNKLAQQMQASSLYAADLTQYMEYNSKTGLWTLPDVYDEKFLHRLYNFRQELGMIGQTAGAITDSLFEGFKEAVKPDQDAATQYHDLLLKIRDVRRELWAADGSDKQAIKDDLKDLEKQANQMKDRVNKSTWTMFKQFVTNAYNAFSQMMQNIAADIIKGQVTKLFESMLMKLFKVGTLGGADDSKAVQAANTLQLQMNTWALQGNVASQQLLAGSLYETNVALMELPLSLTTLDTTMAALASTSQTSTAALGANTTAIIDLTAAVSTLAASMGTGSVGGSEGTFNSIVGAFAGGGADISEPFTLGGGSLGAPPDVSGFGNYANSLAAHGGGRAVPLPEYGRSGGGVRDVHITVYAQDAQSFRRSAKNVMSDAKVAADRAWARAS